MHLHQMAIPPTEWIATLTHTHTNYHIGGSMRIGISSFAETTNGRLRVHIILQKRTASQMFQRASLFLPMLCLDTMDQLLPRGRSLMPLCQPASHTITGSMPATGMVLRPRASTHTPACWLLLQTGMHPYSTETGGKISSRRMPRAREPVSGRSRPLAP